MKLEYALGLKIASLICEDAAEAGYYFGVEPRGVDFGAALTQDPKEAIEVFTTWDALEDAYYLFIWYTKPEARGEENSSDLGKRFTVWLEADAWVKIVPSNGETCISDYSINLEDGNLLKRAMAYAERAEHNPVGIFA